MKKLEVLGKGQEAILPECLVVPSYLPPGPGSKWRLSPGPQVRNLFGRERATSVKGSPLFPGIRTLI